MPEIQTHSPKVSCYPIPGKKLIEWGGVQHGPSQDRPGLKGWFSEHVDYNMLWVCCFGPKSGGQTFEWENSTFGNWHQAFCSKVVCIMLKPRVVRSSFGWCRSLGGFALCPNPLRLWSGSPGHSARSLKLCRIDACWSPPAKTKHLKS